VASGRNAKSRSAKVSQFYDKRRQADCSWHHDVILQPARLIIAPPLDDGHDQPTYEFYCLSMESHILVNFDSIDNTATTTSLDVVEKRPEWKCFLHKIHQKLAKFTASACTLSD